MGRIALPADPPTAGPVPPVRLRRVRNGPPRALLLVSLVAAALVATPLLFLIVELAGAPAGAAWEALARPRTLRLTLSTLLLVVTVTAGTLLLGIPTAFLLTRTDLAGVRGWRIVAALPLAIPSYVAGFAWISLTSVRGFWAAWVVLVLVLTPYITLPVCAALRRADTTPEDVARTLGVGRLRAFCLTTLPQVAPAAGAGALLVALYTVADFGVVAIVRYPALTWAIQTAFSGTFNRALAIVLSLVLVLLALGFVAAERSVRRRTTPAVVRADTLSGRVSLGPLGQPLAQTGLALIAIAAVGVPVVTMLGRALRSASGSTPEWARLAEAAATTVVLGAGGALAAVVLALPVSVLAARHRSPTVTTLESAIYLGHGLPGIVLGLAMVYLTLALVPAFYQTPVLLVVAYGILFAPKAGGSIRAALGQVPVDLEHTARTLGRSAAATWVSVTGRLAWPGIAAGALLVALTVMKELPATLMMRPVGMDTLATRLWQLTDIAAYGAAAPYAIVLIAVASVPALALARQSDRAS